MIENTVNHYFSQIALWLEFSKKDLKTYKIRKECTTNKIS